MQSNYPGLAQKDQKLPKIYKHVIRKVLLLFNLFKTYKMFDRYILISI